MSSIRSRLTSLFSRFRFDPERDWLILLAITMLMFTLIVGWNIWAFRTVVGGGTLGGGPAANATTTITTSLDMIPGLLSERAAEDAKYIDGTYRFADPSL